MCQPGDMTRVKERFPGRIPEWLPRVQCIGSFEDGLTALVVVWFQDEYALPILEPALSQMLALDWESLATDFDL